MRVYWPDTTLVFLHNESWDILLWRKVKSHGFGMWNWFWGKLESNESLLECCVRELKEEAWVSIDSDSLYKQWQILFVWEDMQHKDIDQSIQTYCHIYTWEYSWSFADSDEMKDIQWFSSTALPYESMRQIDAQILPTIISWRHIAWSVLYDRNNKVKDFDLHDQMEVFDRNIIFATINHYE